MPKKKKVQINIDEKKGQLFLGDQDLRLLMLRPIDLIEFSEFAGANAEDIIIWCGKTIGKYFTDKIYPGEDWTDVPISSKKNVIIGVLETLEPLGYGILTSKFKKESILISVEDPLTSEEKDNIMSKNVCLLYQGIFNGILEQLEIDADGQEVNCFLLGDDACIFKYDLLIDEFSKKDIDPDESDTSKPISKFLSNI